MVHLMPLKSFHRLFKEVVPAFLILILSIAKRNVAPAGKAKPCTLGSVDSRRVCLLKDFTPQLSNSPQAVLLHGCSQGPIPVPFTVGLDPQDSHTIVLKLSADLPAGPPDRPGLKAIHLRWGPLNPTQAGDYPISIQLSDAGGLSGTTQAIAISPPNRYQTSLPTISSTKAGMRIGNM